MTGIWMSISTTSGRRQRTTSMACGAVLRLADDLDVGLGLEDPLEPDANELLVVDDHDPDRRRHAMAPIRQLGCGR